MEGEEYMKRSAPAFFRKEQKSCFSSPEFHSRERSRFPLRGRGSSMPADQVLPFLGRRFTLVELLTVIAVIALLASLLLPALARAKGTAKKIVCIGNLKQVGLLNLKYLQDYGYYAPEGYYQGGASWGWHSMLGKLEGWKASPPTYYMVAIYRPNGKSGTPTIFACPEYDLGRNDEMMNYYLHYVTTNRVQYDVWTINPSEPFYQGTKESKVKRPSQTVFALDYGGRKGGTGNRWIPGTGRFDYNDSQMTDAVTCGISRDYMEGRHNMQNNFLYFDGHVETMDSRAAAAIYRYQESRNLIQWGE